MSLPLSLYTRHSIFQEQIVLPQDSWNRAVRFAKLPTKLFSGLKIWETAEEDLIFLEDLPFSEDEADEDGFYFYDENLFPVVLDSFSFWLKIPGSSRSCSIWPFFTVKTFKKHVVFKSYVYRKAWRQRKAWAQAFRFLVRFLVWFTARFITFFLLLLSTAGVGNYCETNQTQLRLIVSNTHDLLFSLPANISAGCVVPSIDRAEATLFFLLSPDYMFLRRYAHYIRTRVRFNNYEYRGLLYWQEVQPKKLTKQKQR